MSEEKKQDPSAPFDAKTFDAKTWARIFLGELLGQSRPVCQPDYLLAVAWLESAFSAGAGSVPPVGRAQDPGERGAGALPSGSPVCPLDLFDARVWAKEFMRRNAHGMPQVIVNEETMVGWFANSLMRGYDEAIWKLHKELVRLAEWAHKNLYGGEPKDWCASSSVSGVLSQLDNMLVGMGQKKPATELERDIGDYEAARQAAMRAFLNMPPVEPDIPAAERERVVVQPSPGSFYPKWLDNVSAAELSAFKKFMESPPEVFPPERLRDMDKRIGELEFRLGSTFAGPGSNLTTEVGKLIERVRCCEAQLPRPGDRTLGTMHEEVCARLSKLESATKRIDALALAAVTESPSYGALSVRCAKAELCVAELEKEVETCRHRVTLNSSWTLDSIVQARKDLLLDYKDLVQRSAEQNRKLKEAVKKWGDRAMQGHYGPGAGSTFDWPEELKEDLK